MPHSSPTTILLVALWTGLTAGFLDLALLIMRKRLFTSDFYRLGDHFWWVIPAGVSFLVFVPGTALAGMALLCRGRVALGWVVGILSFVGFFNACARLPIEVWAALLLSGGLAFQSARSVARHREPFLWLVRRSCPLLIGAVLAILLLSSGGRAWFEYRAMTKLPPSPAGARNVLLIIWDTVRTGNLSLHGYRRPTSPNLERLAGRGVRFRPGVCYRPVDVSPHTAACSPASGRMS